MIRVFALWIPSLVKLVNRLRVKKTNWLLVEPRQGDYLFLLDDDNLIEKTVITRLLRTAALRSGLDPSVMDTHSLRAGGCTAMADAGFPEHEINPTPRPLGFGRENSIMHQAATSIA